MPELYNSGTTARKDHTATYTSSHRVSLFDKMWYMYVHMLAYHVICFLFLHLIKTILRNYLRTIKSKDRWKSYNMLGSNLSHRYRIGGTSTCTLSSIFNSKTKLFIPSLLACAWIQGCRFDNYHLQATQRKVKPPQWKVLLIASHNDW